MNEEKPNYQWDVVQAPTNMVSEKLLVYITDTTTLSFNECARLIHTLRKQNGFFENSTKVSMSMTEQSFEAIIERNRRSGKVWGIIRGEISSTSQLSIHVKVGGDEGIFLVVPLVAILLFAFSLTKGQDLLFALAISALVTFSVLFFFYNEKAKLLEDLKRIFDSTGAAHLH